MRILIFTLFGFGLLVTTSLARMLVGGFPVRVAIMFAVFGLIVVAYNSIVRRFLRLHYPVLIVFFFIAVLGNIVTVATGTTAVELLENNLRHILQPLAMMIVTYAMCHAVGVRQTAVVIIGIVLFHSLIAILQFAGVGAAWEWRSMLGAFQQEGPLVQAHHRLQTRAMGLSLTPIDYSYSVVSAYIIVLVLQHSNIVSLRLATALKFILLVASFANETRSLILGLIVSETLFFLAQGKMRNFLMLFVAIIIGGLLFLQLDMTESRIASTDDQSAKGRLVLYTFGFHLFRDNFLGLGWGFNPPDYAWLYWEYLTDFGKPEIVFRLSLHNAYINYILMYGIFGVLPVIWLAVLYPKRFVLFAMFFSSYLVHSLLHNKGLFVGGLAVWWSFAFYFYAIEYNLLSIKLPEKPRPRDVSRPLPWRYAPAAGTGLPAPGQAAESR